MKSLGIAGSGRPKARPGIYEAALALIVELGGDKKKQAHLKELVGAEADLDKTRQRAEAATAEASRRETAAMAAEASARSQREALAAETMTTESRLTAERNELRDKRLTVEALAKEVDAKFSDLKPREAALRRAFDAYNGE